MSETETLVRELSAEERNAYQQPGSKPRPGSIVDLWRLRGRWHVWSQGPEQGTWWLQPYDDTAREVGAAITERPDRGEPVVKGNWKGHIAVRTKEIRGAGR